MRFYQVNQEIVQVINSLKPFVGEKGVVVLDAVDALSQLAVLAQKAIEALKGVAQLVSNENFQTLCSQILSQPQFSQQAFLGTMLPETYPHFGSKEETGRGSTLDMEMIGKIASSLLGSGSSGFTPEIGNTINSIPQLLSKLQKVLHRGILLTPMTEQSTVLLFLVLIIFLKLKMWGKPQHPAFNPVTDN